MCIRDRCNIGTDVENGLWAIYGARLGCEMTVLTKWDTNLISDYDWFKNFFNNEVAPRFVGDNDMICSYTKLEWEQELLYKEVCRLGHRLNDDINSMMLFNPNEQMCRFFKKTYVNPRRWGAMVREKQIQDLLEKGMMELTGAG